MDYIAQPKDYWIATNAINITRNALGKPNRIQCSVASGAAILCYIEGVTGLGYDNGHRFRTWPLTISPTYFNSNTKKYVYVAIPRTSSVGTQAVVVFPSEKLDIYGVNANDEQVGSTEYYYIWLQGILTATDGTSNREWQQAIDFGKKGTDEDLYDDTSSEWFQYSKVNEVVTFLKNIAMKAGTTFHNLILGYKELTGVATSDTAYTDSDTLVATPGYIESQYLSKTHESEAQEVITFAKGVVARMTSSFQGISNSGSIVNEGDVTTATISGSNQTEGLEVLTNMTLRKIVRGTKGYFKSLFSDSVETDNIKSSNYTGDDIADTGFRLTNSHNGHSKLTIDEIYVRMKAVFESLEVKERTYSGGDQIWSCAGNRIIRVDYLGNVEDADHVPQMMNVHADGRPEGQGQGDVYSVPVPGDTYGYSDVKVPWLLRQMPLLARAKVFARYRKVRIVINEPAGNSANRAAASESPLANIRRARCYFLAKDDDMEVHNWWRINDLARCQTMNLANTTRQTYISGEGQKAGNIFWWRKVIGVSYEPVTLDDGKQYHYFDVAFDYEYEQSHPEVMATSVMEGSDIPAAQDSVVQFGNTIIEGRMNLMMMEVNGGDAVGYNPTTDAPCLKAYRGVYCFDLNKSWVGGRCCKMKLSPKSGYEFYGPNFKMVTEYDVVPVPMDRGLWNDIIPTRDDYSEHANVRKCYYYDKVSHNGSYWLCSIVDGSHWVDSNDDYISDAAYSALTEEQKALCSRKQNYTIEEPSANSTDWTEVVRKGDAAPYYVEYYGIGSSRTSHADILWKPVAPTPTAQNPYVWKLTRLYNPNTQTYGDATYVCLTGDDGKDGWMITANPANVIITQALDNDTTQFSTVKVGFTAKKGSAPATVSSLAIPAGQQALSNEFNAAIGTGDDAKKVIVSSPKTYTPQGGTAQYYTEGTFAVGVIATDPDTGSSVTFNVTVPCYANLLGTWKESVEAGVKTVVAEVVTYDFLDGKLTKNGRTYTQTASAAGNYETWSSSSNTSEGSRRWMNEHINTAEANISTVSGKVNGLETSVSQISQTADEIKMSVNRGYRNYILNPKATDAVTGIGTMSEISDPVMGNVMNIYNADDGDFQLFCQFDDDNRSDLTNQVVVCYAVVKPKSISPQHGVGRIDFGIWSANQHKSGLLEANSTAEGVVSHVSSSESGATAGMVPIGSGWYIVWSSFNAGSVFQEEKEAVGINSVNGSRWLVYGYGVMIGNTCPTFEAILTNTGLRSAGIDIKDGTVNLYGDKVTFSDSSGGNTDKISIDPATGTLNAKNARITGGVFVDRVDILNEPAFYDNLNGKEVAYRFFDVKKGENLFDNYYAIGELTLKSNHLFVYSEGLRNRSGVGSYEHNMIELILPPAHHFIGQSIVITNESYGFTDDEVLLEVEYKHDVGNNSDYVCLTHKDFFQESDTYLYDSAPLDIDGAPYVTDAYEKQVGEGKTIDSAYLSNGIWQLLESSQGKKYYEIQDAIEIGSYAWLELTAVSGELQGWYYVDPQLAKTYNAVWMITRWEKK